MRKHLQADFVRKVMPNVDGGQTKAYLAAFVLSHSRYKHTQMQSRLFTSVDLTRIRHDCFQYIGGMPAELVFDQDSIVCVSENAGDVICTCELEKFRQECGLAIRIRRGADPESTGKIENTVKYVKSKFLSHRVYTDDGVLNGNCLEWLERTANARAHGAPGGFQPRCFRRSGNICAPCPRATRLSAR